MNCACADFAVEVISAGIALGLAGAGQRPCDTFRANAELKAHAAATAANLPALADDSGLVVDALGGAPGIYSARWAGPNKDFAAAMKRVEQKLNGQDRKSPRILCARYPSRGPMDRV